MPVNAHNEIYPFVAPDFNAISVDDKQYRLKDLVGEKGFVIAFICNHCPYVIKIIQRLVFESNQLNKIGISTICIMSNDVKSYPKDSLLMKSDVLLVPKQDHGLNFRNFNFSMQNHIDNLSLTQKES